MKNILFYYIFLFFSSLSWGQDLFEQGNEHYRKGNYNEAVQLYEQLLKENKHSCDLYFNLGNAYYKLNQIAPAIYYYEKALLLSPNDKDIANNLKFAKARTIDDIKDVPKVGFEKLLQSLTGMFHYNTWAYISIGFSSLFFIFFLGYYFSETTLKKRVFFVGMFTIPVFIFISVFSGWFEKHLYQKERPAIVCAESTSVKNEPKNSAGEAFILHEGTKVFVLETLDQWKKIQLADETEGWILSEDIREIKN